MRGRSIFILLAATATAAAAAPPTLDDLSKLQQTLRGRQEQREAFEMQAEAARVEIAKLNAELSTLSLGEATGQLSVNDKRMRLAELGVRETDLASRVGANRNRLSHLLGGLQLYSRNPPPALFVRPDDAKDAVRAAILIRAVTPELERRALHYAQEVDEVRQLRRKMAAGSAELFSAESAVAEQRAKLEAAIAAKIELERQASGDLLIADREIAEIAGRAETMRKFLGALPAPIAKASAGARPSGLRPPVGGAPIRRFGDRDANGARSEGWSWRPGAGSLVSSPASGVVEYAGALYGWNDVLILKLSGGYHAVLAGMSGLTVKPGQSVAVGEAVGRMANSSAPGVGSRPVELYLEVRRSNGPVDPGPFMQ